MDEPIQILIDELLTQEKTESEILDIVEGLSNPDDQLDMAEWLLYHRGATRQEMLREKHRLQRKRAI